MSQPVAHRLIVFTRFPEPGNVKTRLIPHLGAGGAAALHRRLTQMTLDAVAELRNRSSTLDVVVRFTGGTRQLMSELYGEQWTFEEQGAGDLGARIACAFADAFAAGRTDVAVIGSDCPALTGARLNHAFTALRTWDLVVGPALDGGYYLMGLKQLWPDLFRDMRWGGSDVLEETLRRGNALRLGVQLLPALRDVDTPADLAELEQVTPTARQPPCEPPRYATTAF